MKNFLFWFSLKSEKSGNALFLIAKGQKFLPPQPPSFLPFCFNARRAGAAGATKLNWVAGEFRIN